MSTDPILNLERHCEGPNYKIENGTLFVVSDSDRSRSSSLTLSTDSSHHDINTNLTSYIEERHVQIFFVKIHCGL